MDGKILLVDDVDLFLELERSYLEGCGYDLVTASSGEETLQRLDKIARMSCYLITICRESTAMMFAGPCGRVKSGASCRS